MPARRMSPGQFAVAYLAVLLALALLDGAWLGLVAKDLYRREMGSLMADSIRVWPAALFYSLYPLAVVYLALVPAPAGWAEAGLRAAVLGLAAYGAYNFTNLSVVRGWPIGLSAVDLLWGGFVTAAAGLAGYWAAWGRG